MRNSRSQSIAANLRFHVEYKILHFRTWHRDALAGYVRETLLDPRSLLRPYVERKELEAVVRGHLRSGRNYTTEIHKLPTLETVHRVFLDKPEGRGTRARAGVPAALTAVQWGVATRFVGGAGGVVEVWVRG